MNRTQSWELTRVIFVYEVNHRATFPPLANYKAPHGVERPEPEVDEVTKRETQAIPHGETCAVADREGNGVDVVG